MRRVVALLGSLALASGGCATLSRVGVRPPDGGRECAGEIVSTKAIADEFYLLAQVRVLAAPDVDWGLTLAAQKIEGSLVVVGLDGFGAKLFTISQDGTEVDVDRVVGRRMPWPPGNLLRDLHRVRLGAAEGEGVSIDRGPEGAGRMRVTIRNAVCGSETIIVLAEDGPVHSGGGPGVRNLNHARRTSSQNSRNRRRRRAGARSRSPRSR